MKLSYRTQRDTEHGNVTEYHSIDNAGSVECEVDSNHSYTFISKSYSGESDELFLYIGDVCVKFPVTMVDTVLKRVKLTMEEYDNKLHEEQLEDERSADAK
jgi:hypothetical protein